MSITDVVLHGRHVRLEPLSLHHVPGLVAAAASDPSLYRWTPVPQGRAQTEDYVAAALSWRDAGTALPFAIIRVADNAVIGSSRFFNHEYWPWPPQHPSHGRTLPDACEIGYTWFAADSIRTAANTESKLLMMTHAFEIWKVVRVCFHTDARNERSRAALERIGGKFEGILRAHRLAVDSIPRDSARFSIIPAEWPAVKSRLEARLNKR